MNITLPPALKRFVDAQVATGRYSDAGDVVRQSLRLMESSVAALSRFDGGDVESMVFEVFLEAAKSAREDLKAIMEEVKAINAAKTSWRALLLKVRRDIAGNSRRTDQADRTLDLTRGMGSERAYHRTHVPRLDPDCPGGVCYDLDDLYPARIRHVEDLRAIAAGLQANIDSLAEMSEMTSLRLQMALDRRSKSLSTLSNVMKKISETSATLIGSMK